MPFLLAFKIDRDDYGRAAPQIVCHHSVYHLFFFFWSKNMSYHRSYKLQRTLQGVSSRLRDLAVGGFRRLIRLIKKKGERAGRKGREGMQAGPSQSYAIETDESKYAYG